MKTFRVAFTPILFIVLLSTGIGLAAEIPSMTTDHIVFDFDSMPAGATTVVNIKAAFPGSQLDDLVFNGRSGTGTYDSSTSGGRALALNASGSGLELIDPPSGVFGNANDLTITLTEQSTEIGFQIGDYTGGPFYVNLFDGLSPVGSFTVAIGSGPNFIQNDTPFDRIVLTFLPDNPAANWVVSALYIQETAAPPVPVPTINEWGMIIFSLLMSISAAWFLRRSATET